MSYESDAEVPEIALACPLQSSVRTGFYFDLEVR